MLYQIELVRRRLPGYDRPTWRGWRPWPPANQPTTAARLALVPAIWPQHRFRLVVTPSGPAGKDSDASIAARSAAPPDHPPAA